MAVLQTRDMDEHQRESLEHRISNRLILSESQLKTTAVRTEILEAEGSKKYKRDSTADKKGMFIEK